MGVLFLKLLAQFVLLFAPWLGGIIPAIAGSVVSASMQVFFGVAIILFLVFEPRGLSNRWQITLATFRIWPYPH
jgi:branched-chain amino acid transport system permease protein